ncbi:MAG: prepilin peptidase [Lachnospiraceae bacterium]|nr:prepilin peptidase [Lachnospiraceae bacterium]
MKEIQMLSLLCIAGTAVLFDLHEGRIPNGIVVTGILWGGTYQLFARGAMGLLLFLGGVFLPILLFGGFYYFRMIGAGDIKLMCVMGGFLGPSDCFACITAAILFGGMISLAIILRRHNISQRLICLSDYIDQYSKEKQWNSYLEKTKEDARFCFSVPVLLGILCYIGGII